MAAQREWFEKDYYKALGVSDTATEKEITRAYRKLAKQFHPDAGGGNEEKFKELSAAYDVLGDAAKRKEYDEVRRLGPVGAGGFRPFGDQGFGGSFRVEDLGDLFGGLFNRGRGRGGPGPADAPASGPRRGQDVEAELYLSFLDAVHGITTSVNVVSDAVCSRCHGVGAEPGTSPVICPTCGGRGVIDENQGFFSFSRPCPTCGGSGMKVETPCRVCHASGVEHRPRQVKVRIPAGVDNGQRIRVKGRGGAGQNGGPSGDLYVVVTVAPHELFGRNGKDLTLTVPITFAEAALGATVKVPTLDAPVSVKIPAGTKSGRTFRVRGHGVPLSSEVGDLLVTVEVAVPADGLTDEQRAALERLAQAFPESPRGYLGV
jgi:molecular chaperone DnaJ